MCDRYNLPLKEEAGQSLLFEIGPNILDRLQSLDRRAFTENNDLTVPHTTIDIEKTIFDCFVLVQMWF